VRAFIIGIVLMFKWAAFAQPALQKPKVIPLTRDEFAVYKAFIADYRSRGEREDLLVVDHTGPLAPDEGDYATCMKGFPKPDTHQQPRSFEHRLEGEWKVKLVHTPIKAPPEYNGEVILRNDTHESAPGYKSKPLASTAECSIQFSGIIFDRRHRRAAFWAGMSCTNGGGRGGTLVFERAGQTWRESDTCPIGLR
jgi:hypothetical protein